jgi:uracil-DNA glycosylase
VNASREPASAHRSCPGYPPPYAGLVAAYPGVRVYPDADFRTEWGPIFHRGRLDGSARVLVLGQDPAAHESIARRILIGEAGQRAQGLLAKLGVTASYVMVNTFLYSVYGQGGGERHVHDPAIAAYRNRWLDTLAANNRLEAIITFGGLAETAYTAWKATPSGRSHTIVQAALTHPTYPESAAASGQTTLAAATAAMLADWNQALPVLHAAVTHPDTKVPLLLYGAALAPTDEAPIPEADLPPGLPAWMRGLENWAERTGSDAASKRRTITVTVPTDQVITDPTPA